MEKLEEVITASVGIVLALSKLAELWWKKRKVKINEKRLKSFIEDSKHCNFLAESIVKDDIADRVFVFRAHDSGGVPKLGMPYYTSVVSSFYKDKEKDKSKRYNNIHVDDSYKDTILSLIENNKVKTSTKKMNEGMLKNIYEDEGIVYGHIYKLAITNNSFFYMSVSWFTEPSDSQILAADLIANQIQTIYKKHHNNNV